MGLFGGCVSRCGPGVWRCESGRGFITSPPHRGTFSCCPCVFPAPPFSPCSVINHDPERRSRLPFHSSDATLSGRCVRPLAAADICINTSTHTPGSVCECVTMCVRHTHTHTQRSGDRRTIIRARRTIKTHTAIN